MDSKTKIILLIVLGFFVALILSSLEFNSDAFISGLGGLLILGGAFLSLYLTGELLRELKIENEYLQYISFVLVIVGYCYILLNLWA